MKRVAQGDERAFLTLYDCYVGRVHALTLRILGNPMLAEEATQDTFLKLWSRSRDYQPERGPLLTWLLTIARRTALDRLRLEGRRPTLSDSNDPTEAWRVIPDRDSVSEESRWRSLHFAIQALSPEHRQVIELAYYQGLSQSEIAEELGWPLGTVKSRLRAAMEILRQEWAQNKHTPTRAPAAMEPAAVPVTGGAAVDLGKNDALGSFLADDKGMTLYLFTKDTPNTSNCYDKCATAWPPLLTTGNAVAGDGVDKSMLGTTTRKDGSTQVTYNSWPLYYYQKDKAPGDVVGQDVGSVWFVISPAGEKVESSAAANEPPAASAGAATVNLGKDDKLGSFLVDGKGITLYLFTKDTPNTSVCYDKCATAWPPLLTTGAAVGGDGVDSSKFGTTTRKDGSVQVTYNGWPLYYYQKDKAPGDVTGQDVGGVWYVVSAAGDKVTTP